MLEPITGLTLVNSPVGLLAFRHDFEVDENGEPHLQPGVTISLGDLKSLLLQVTGEDVSGQFISHDIFFMGENLVGWRVPEQVRTIKFNVRGVKFSITCPMPAFAVVSNGDRIKVCAIKDQKITEETECYHAPLMNFFADGTMCQGSVPKPSTHPKDNRYAWESMIFSSYFSHISHKQLIAGKDVSNESYIHLLKSLVGKRKFPASALVSMRTTMKEFLRGMV